MSYSVCINCKKEFYIKPCDLKRGRGKFCSRLCFKKYKIGVNNSSYKHGYTMNNKVTKEYKIWAGIKRRTTHFGDDNSKYYIGRGIKICDRWKNSFINFIEDMGKCPSKNHTIDRINNDGNYEKDNCRWATQIEQMSNTRNNKKIKYNGETHTQEEWGRITGIGGTNICKRLKRGWSIKKSLTKPLKS